MARLSYAQLEQVWQQAGGSAQLAPTMAAIALAESGGRTDALNDNAGTGDYSVGLWQINYYGSLAPSRTARYGPPDALRLGPGAALANARAAVSLAAGGAGLSNWSTYTSGAYRIHLQGDTPAPTAPAAGGGTSTSGYQRSRPGQSSTQLAAWWDWLNPLPFTPSLSGLEGIWKSITGAISAPWDVVKAFLWLSDPRTWLRVFEALLGLWLIFLSLAGLAAILLARSRTAGQLAGVASAAPGPLGAAGRAVTAVRSLGSGRRTRASSPRRKGDTAAARGEPVTRTGTPQRTSARDRATLRRHARERARRRRDRDQRYGDVPF